MVWLFQGGPPILSLPIEPEASDNKLWKTITNSTKGPLANHLPPSKTRLPNRGLSYILPYIRTERFKRCFIDRCLFSFI